MNAGAPRGRVEIGRFLAEYRVLREHPAPEQVRDRLDAVLARDLPQTLDAVLSPWLSQGEPGLWLIRRLEVEVSVNAAWDRDALARVWAGAFARALVETLAGGDDGANVLWFPDRAAYLARFLVDAAEGVAWGQWQYAPFDGLRLLPASAVLRTAACEEPAVGQAALLRLAPDELMQVLRTLSAQDARRILDRLAEAAPGGEPFRCLQAARAAWRSVLDAGQSAGSEWQDALRLYLAAALDSADAGGLSLRTAVLALLRLHRLLSEGATGKEGLLTALTGGDMAALYLAAGTADAEVLQLFLGCPPEWVREIARQMVQRPADVDVAQTGTPGRRYTPFGGLFLLLPHLDALPLEEATHGWPDAEEVSAVTLTRYLLLLKCLGGERAAALFYDPLARDLMGIPPALTPAAVADWLRRIRPAQRRTFLAALEAGEAELTAADRDYLALPGPLRPSRALDHVLSTTARDVMRAFARRLPGFAGSNLPYLYRNFLEMAGSVEEEPARRVVRLARPPLHLVLTMTGMLRATYAVRWLDARPFALFPED